jgi:hypothetical protein
LRTGWASIAFRPGPTASEAGRQQRNNHEMSDAHGLKSAQGSQRETPITNVRSRRFVPAVRAGSALERFQIGDHIGDLIGSKLSRRRAGESSRVVLDEML